MLLGARLAIFGGAQNPPPSANPYVTDGLIFQIDGIWNGGIGVHDETLNSCVDLCNSGIVAPCTNHENYLTFAANMVSSKSTLDWVNNWVDFNGQRKFHTEAVVYSPSVSSSMSSLTLWLPISFGSSNITVPAVSFNGVGKVKIDSQGGMGTANSYTLPSPLYTERIVPVSFGSAQGKSEAGIYRRGLDGEVFAESSLSANANSMSITPDSYAADKRPYLKTGTYFGADCRVYSFRVYSRVLTADEIAANYAVDKVRFNLA